MRLFCGDGQLVGHLSRELIRITQNPKRQNTCGEGIANHSMALKQNMVFIAARTNLTHCL
jgi:hypothetical protein